MGEENINFVIESLNEMIEDSSVPRNVKSKISSMIDMLNGSLEISIKANKALQELDEINNDSNLQTYTRTQIWNVVSLLEKLA